MLWAACGLKVAAGSAHWPGQISQSDFTERSRVSSKVCLNDWPSTETIDTRARLIMSAEAVLAVRRGLRSAFWRASLPLTWEIRAGSHPKTRATGTAKTGLTRFIPTNTNRALIPSRAKSELVIKSPMMATTSMAKPRISTRACPTGWGRLRPPTKASTAPNSAVTTIKNAESEEMPNATRITLSAVSSFSNRVERRSSVRRAGRLPVMAAIGDTRRARRAGQMADTAVTSTPTKMAARMALAPTTMGESGSLAPKLEISAWMPRDMSTPSPRPAALATTPTATASPTTMAVTCRPLAPMARSSPNSRVRWLTRMVKVL